MPNQLLEALELELDEGNSYNWRHDRITKMAIIAARQACQNLEQNSIPNYGPGRSTRRPIIAAVS